MGIFTSAKVTSLGSSSFASSERFVPVPSALRIEPLPDSDRLSISVRALPGVAAFVAAKRLGVFAAVAAPAPALMVGTQKQRGGRN